ncbi:carboxypeptidase [Bacillus sp. LL01]|uniref:M20 family metallopeptidase n=1 Tax=Bacillus sp. LL01 TaxID=1665556 RepID=UPI00064D699A|nr:M20 family metallopeptidase [Bacillus sp. LL01]KMJ59531.1 carboxypeptidase [Bacillus sp. LL01]
MQEFLQNNQTEMLNLLEKLVNIDSGSTSKEGIDKIGSILSKEYRSIGFSVQVIEEERYGNHLVIQHPMAKEPRIIIVAHMDTVFPNGTVQTRPFKVEGERAYGPGVIDMKASQVSILYAMKALIYSRSNAYRDVVLVLNSDEEIGSPSSKSLIESKAEGKEFALIMEPARKDGSLVSARRGKGKYTISVKGRAAHSGIEPEKGRSAIEELAHKVIQLHELNDYSKGISVNVGLIEGGSSVNTVSDSAVAHVDIRIKNRNQAIPIERKLEKICASSDVQGTEVELSGEMNRLPMEKTERTESLLQVIEKVGIQMGLKVKDTATGGGSDASFTAAMGIATVDGMGPVGGNAHSEKEYLEVPSLTKRTELLARTIAALVE